MAINDMMAMAPQQAEQPQEPMPPMQPPEAGFINEPEAMPPQEGGEESVADDIPMEAEEGDYILPYETVLLVGLKDLNRYAKEAIQLALRNNVNLSGTNIDPTDKVPIKISNYEYRIPKILVPFFGGGKKYLDDIREEGLQLRKRLEEERKAEQKIPAKQEQPMPPLPQEPSPAQPEGMIPPSPPQQQTPPPPPMMQKGGFVKDKDAAMLEKDEAPTTQEQTRLKAQQPAMMTPDGKRVQQGFSAPAGYNEGGELEKTSQQVPDWVKRALDPSSPIKENEDGSISTVRTQSSEVNGKILLYPTLRKQGDKLVPSDLGDALKKKDFIEFPTEEAATEYSKQLSNQIYGMRGLQKASGGFVTR